VYDGFITTFEDNYECGLCKENKQTYWKYKKNASLSSVVLCPLTDLLVFCEGIEAPV
jgi:hypothetical protein